MYFLQNAQKLRKQRKDQHFELIKNTLNKYTDPDAVIRAKRREERREKRKGVKFNGN